MRKGNQASGQYIEPMLFSRWLDHHPGPVVPTLCAVCRGWAERRVCSECAARHAARTPRCAVCAIDVQPGIVTCGACLSRPPAFDKSVAAVRYDYPWDRLAQSFKFHDGLDLASVMAAQIGAAVAHADLPASDWIVPVPLSDSRLRERGYNQAWELARRVARRSHGRADARLLLRVKDTAHQADLPRDRRTANVRGAFMVAPGRATELRGAVVAVVDDVMTTGATAEEIARTLKQAGAASVQIWAYARTPLPDD